MTVKKICVLGLGDAGVPLSAVIALKCPEIRVSYVEGNSEVIYQWNTGTIPPSVYVPGLDDFMRKCQNRNLFFSTNEALAIKEAEIIFIVSESTLKSRGEGEDQVVDLSKVEEAARLIAEHAESNKIVVEYSSMPLKAAECIKSVFKYSSKPGVKFQVLSNPEFYTQGSSLRNVLFPSCVLLGSEKTPEGLAAAKKVSSLYERWVPPKSIITMSHLSAEISKVFSSAMMAQTFATIYATICVCEETGGKLSTILEALPSGYGQGLKSLELTFNVGKLIKELRNFVYMCECLDMKEVAGYWREVVRMYDLRRQRFMEKFFSILNQTVNKKIAVLGFAYYKDTHVTEGSEAVDLCRDFLKENAVVSVFDPRVQQKQVIEDLLSAGCKMSQETLNGLVTVHDDPYKAAHQSQAVVAWANWPEFTELDYERIFAGMMKPAYVFDWGGHLPHAKLSDIGFKVEALGKATKCFFYS